jgi:flagellar L-ring protein precursor FlgH
MTVLRLLAVVAIVFLLQACATEPVDMVLRPSPEFQPVYPLASDRQKVATGGIYSNRQSDSWFGRGRNYQVGDIITVLLNEATQAARTQNTDVSRESKSSLPSGANAQVGKLNPFLSGINLNDNTNSSKGAGKADQQASLSGSVAVTVVEILANGNLMVRGEKKLGLSEGTEVIQVSGVIRPEDVGPNSTVQSRRLANAQIAYRGSGDLANATKAGWGTSLMHKYWPF